VRRLAVLLFGVIGAFNFAPPGAQAQSPPGCPSSTQPAVRLAGLPASIRPSRTEAFGLADNDEATAQVPGPVSITITDRFGGSPSRLMAAAGERGPELFSVSLDRGDRSIAIAVSYVEIEPTGAQCLRVVSRSVLEGKPMRLVLSARASGVTGVGPFRPRSNATLGAAIRALGEPTSLKSQERGSVCRVGWRPLGLTVMFVNFGLNDSCEPSDGFAQTLVIRGDRGRQWRTSKGLRIGQSTRQIRRRHPSAVRRGSRAWRVVTGRSFIGGTCGGRGCPYSLVSASTSGGRVTELRAFIGGAGD